MSQPLHLRAHVASAPSYRLFGALWGGLAVVDVARSAQASSSLQLGLLVVLAAGLCLGQGKVAALAVAGIVWLVATGFVINSWGELHLTGAADAGRLLAVALVALAATEVAR
jgi:hypothetical protein